MVYGVASEIYSPLEEAGYTESASQGNLKGTLIHQFGMYLAPRTIPH